MQNLSCHKYMSDSRRSFSIIPPRSSWWAIAIFLAGLVAISPRPSAAQIWVATGSMTTGRLDHTATLLPNGKVLIAGGCGNSGNISGAELYDPAKGTFSPTGSMTVARCRHTATLLPNGKVLVAGGSVSTDNELASAELYDPAAGTFTATGSMANAREKHTAALLGDGKVLVAGGFVGPFCSTPLSSAELYDPASGTFAPTGSLTTPRSQAAATLLKSGNVLVAGGESGICTPDSATAELYDPSTGMFTATGSMSSGRGNETATLLGNGKALVAGGTTGPSITSTADLYDPTSGLFTATGSMTTDRSSHTATLLGGGQVLIAGGQNSTGASLSSAELYDPVAGTFSATASMTTVRTRHTATLLNNGQVLVTGGVTSTALLASAELFAPIVYNVCLLYDPTHAVKSGAVIPIKIALCDANGNDLSSSSVVVTATSLIQVSTQAPDTIMDAGSSNPENNFRFDSTLGTTGGYIFNLSTSGLSTGTYNLNFTAGSDPTTHTLSFQVK